MGGELDYLKNRMREIKSEYDKTSNEVSALFNDEHVSKEIFPNLPNSIHSLISRLLDANAVLVQWNNELIRYCDIIESGGIEKLVSPQIVENENLLIEKKPEDSEPILEQAEHEEKRLKVKNMKDRTARDLNVAEKNAIVNMKKAGKKMKEIVESFHLKNIWVVKDVWEKYMETQKHPKKTSQKELGKSRHSNKKGKLGKSQK